MNPVIIWDLEDDPDGNYVHIVTEGHGVTVEEVEEVLRDRRNETVPSHSSGNPATFGWTETGKHIIVVWEHVDDDPLTIYPITAYESAAEKAEEAMSGKRIHRKLDRTPEEIARLKATRERLQREKPTVEQLLVEGGHENALPLGDLLAVHQIAHRLKEARKRLDLSLTDLSLKTGIDPAALARLENGEQSNPTMETLAAWRRRLGSGWFATSKKPENLVQ